MIRSYLSRNEGKTLEFKENCRPLRGIIRTAVAFANTAGGSIVIGIRDKTREIVGLDDPLADEERLANAFAQGIGPLLVPDLRIHSWRDRELIVVSVAHTVGPYYVQSEGPESGVYVRLGSTNRRAGPEMIAELQRRARNTSFDEQPCPESNSEDIDFRAASEFFRKTARSLTPSKRKSLGLIVEHGGTPVPSIGAVLLFGKKRRDFFSDATLRCARFAGKDMARFLDQVEIDEYLPEAIESAITFIERHTLQGIDIGRVRRKDRPEYPPEAVREAIINAVVHADYGITGAGTKVGIFDDRIEITNPGLLPFGMTLKAALSGVSCLRNRVLGRTFRELGLIEQWGSGIGRMLAACTERGLMAPKFEEIGTNFRVTLYGKKVTPPVRPKWQTQLGGHLLEERQISTREAAALWKISDRAARARLKKLVDKGMLAELGTGPTDPHRKYVLSAEE